MTWMMLDIETDGPAPGLYSMVSFGCVIIENPNSPRFFKGFLKPISNEWVPEALAVSGHSREECLGFPDPKETMSAFQKWVEDNTGTRKFRGETVPDAKLICDNPQFDGGFMNYYFWRFCGSNPFGHTSAHLGSIYKGMERSMFKSFKHLRDTKHTHDPVDDARGNVEALLKMKNNMGLAIKL